MNIIEFLQKDHQEYAKELVDIKRGLKEVGLVGKITQLISHCELHESVAHKVFSALSAFPKNLTSCEWVSNYKVNHEEMWKLLEKLKDSLWTKNVSSIQSAFSNFHTFIERYMSIEQLSLFPVIQEALNDNIRQELGERAERYYHRFLNPAV